MMIPKISEGVAENVDREARRNIVKYAKEKTLEINKENPVLSSIIDALATETSQSTDDLYTRIYFSMIVLISLINTQMEVNDLTESWN